MIPPDPVPPRIRSTAAASIRLAAAVAVLVLASLASAGVARADGVPYQDPNAHGFIGLCDKSGQPIDHGSVDDTPFVWAAIGSERAPAPYDADGRTATFYAYQPREGLTPGEWSGDMLTASARYSNPAHPMAQATEADGSLADFLDAYPPAWDGLIQLRIYLGAPNQPLLNQTYAATDIRIDGDTWTVVRGGNVACDSGTAVSLEELVKPAVDPAGGPTTTTTAAVAVTATTASTADPAPATTVASGDESAAAPASSSSSDGPPVALAVALVLLIAAAIAASLIWLGRRRRESPT